MSSSTDENETESVVCITGNEDESEAKSSEEELNTTVADADVSSADEQVEEVTEISADTETVEDANDVEDVNKKHPGVFAFSENKDVESVDLQCKEELPARSTRSQEAKELRGQDILESLPCIERLRSIAGSTVSGEKSETGDNVSDRESVTSGVVTRNSRRRDKKTVQVNKAATKKLGLNTRSSKGKGRRSVAKKKPVKSITTAPTPVTSEKIYFKGEYYVVGDIVSVTDLSGDIFYGQLRGFLTDEYGDKSAVMSWLLPTTGSPPPSEGFHPATYIIGPEEEIPRSMDVFTFVMHAPSDYFYNRNSPYRTRLPPPASSKDGFKSVRLGPRVRRTADNKTVYVGIYS